MQPNSSKSSAVVPLAIVVGFGLIALAIYFGGGRSAPESQPVTGENAERSASASDERDNIRPIDETDYIRGNPNAPIMIVEYSDYDCPFCKAFHQTMRQIMDEYGATGQVGWVYRQMPIPQLHPNAPRISQAALCVGELGGPDAFWQFSDRIFEERGEAQQTNVTRLPQYAESTGINMAEYTSCTASDRHQDRIEASVEDAFGAGANGTPYSFIIVGNQQAAIEGAQPYSVVKQIIEDLLGQLEGQRPGASFGTSTPQQ